MRLVAPRLANAGESATLAVNQAAAELRKQGRSIIDLGVGEPDFPTPRPVIDAAIAALEAGFTKYTPAIGIPELRAAISERLNRSYGSTFTREEVAVTVGAKQALFNVFMTALDEGDEVIIPSPSWVSFAPQVELVGGVPRSVASDPAGGFAVDPAAVERAIGPRTRALVINSPCNPTGTVLSREVMTAIVGIVRKHDLLLVSDETYELLVFEPNRHTSMAEFHAELGERLVLVGSFSKSYAMTGMRVGYLAAARPLIAGAATLQSHTTSNPTSIAQHAALAALRHPGDLVTPMVAEYHARRDLVVTTLRAIDGVNLVVPGGTFYAFPSVAGAMARLGVLGSVELARRMLADEGVAVVPGLAFGAEGFIRVSFATGRAELEEGLSRISRALS